MKTPEEMAEEAIRWVKTLPPASQRCNQCACEGYRAGYKAAKDEEATKDQKIAALWTESIKNMLPSVHEITLFPSKLKEDK